MKKIKFFLLIFVISTMLFTCACTQLTGLLGGTQTCTVHKDLNRDSVCDTCGAQIPVNCTSHTDKNHDGKCDTGGCSVELAVFHTDADHDGICDGEECSLTFEVVHSDVNGDGKCDICSAIVEKASCTTCIDADKDGKCDVCGSTVKKETCDECVDSDSNGKCDECGSKVAVKCECMDENFDGKCDKCKEKMENALIFADNGISPYSFVIANGLGSSTVKAVQKLMKELEALGVSGNEFKYERDSETEYEVLFGYVTQRGEDYAYNMYSLGMEGYAVEVVGKKIIVTAGSEETLSDAIDIFRTEFLGITSDTKTLKNRAIYESQGFAVIQDNYKITSVSIEGEDISGYTIAIDKNHLLSLNLASTVQTLFYQYTGYRPKIVDISESDKSIVLEMLPKSGNEGLYINVKSGELRISCEFEGSFEVEVKSFFERSLKLYRGDLNYTAAEYNTVKNVRDVYYSQFGAVGDGRTDDFLAIVAAHEHANKGGNTVYADPGATYYIGDNGGKGYFISAVVKTDTYFGDAKFIIDDSRIPYDLEENGVYARECPVFSVEPSVYEAIMGANPNGITKDATNIGFAPGYQAVVVVLNTSHKQYIRYGANADSGLFRCETILVDKDGNIEPSTALMWDYEKISYCRVYYTEDAPITISGGHFVTKYNQAPSDYTQYERSITVTRSNVTVKNMTHRYEDYGETGGPSGGFIIVQNCYNTLIDKINVEKPKTFYELGSDGVTLVGMGSYEFTAGFAVNVTWQNCDQVNFYDESGVYAQSAGMMGTNNCKNMFYLNNRLSSFDSHTGAQNITIKNCEIEHINCIGAGEVIVEDTIVHAMHQRCVIILRGDYGSLWMGDVKFKNVTLITKDKTSVALFQASWPGPGHNFGFASTMPTNVYVDNIIIDSWNGLNKILLCNGSAQLNADWLYWNDVVVNPKTNEEFVNLNPYKLVERLYIKNCDDYQFWMPANFTTEIIYE